MMGLDQQFRELERQYFLDPDDRKRHRLSEMISQRESYEFSTWFKVSSDPGPRPYKCIHPCCDLFPLTEPSESMTAYNDPESNKPLWLCAEHQKEHYEQMTSMWNDYYSQRM